MDMKKILQTLDGASKNPAEGFNDMKRFMQIVEGKGPFNRLTQAESIAMQEQPKKKNVTKSILNVKEDAQPSMIGKYFKSVTDKLVEAEQRHKDRAGQLAKRVIERVTIGPDGQVSGGFRPSSPDPNAPKRPAGGNVESQATVILGGNEYRVVLQGDIRGRYSPGPGTPRVSAQGYIEGDVITLTINPPTDMKEGVAGPKQCWPGHRKVGTKPGTGKNAGKRVNDCEKIKGK